MKIQFTVPAIPVAQPRQRSTKFGGNYIPKEHPIHAFKASVRMAAREVYQGPPLDVPMTMYAVFTMPRPKSLKDRTCVQYTLKKNDWDNLGKAVCDALNGLLFTDDGLIWRVIVERWYANPDEQPNVWVEFGCRV